MLHNRSVANPRGFGLSKCDYEFAPDQRWCRTPQQLHFIDETQELVSNYEAYFDHEDVASPGNLNGNHGFTPERVIASGSPSAITIPTSSPRIDDFHDEQRGDHELRDRRRKFKQSEVSSCFDASPGPSRTFINSPTTASSLQQRGSFSGSLDCLNVVGEQSTGVTGDLNHLSPAVQHTSAFAVATSPTTESLTRIYLETPIWPLREREEAMLMRYFVENLSPCFDLCDPDRHFALVVPHRAAVCPVLLNAIFACSAKHLSRVSGFDPYISDRYHQECLKHLIPMLNDSAAVMDENLLAATVILRFLEEVQGETQAFTVRIVPARIECC